MRLYSYTSLTRMIYRRIAPEPIIILERTRLVSTSLSATPITEPISGAFQTIFKIRSVLLEFRRNAANSTFLARSQIDLCSLF